VFLKYREFIKANLYLI